MLETTLTPTPNRAFSITFETARETESYHHGGVQGTSSFYGDLGEWSIVGSCSLNLLQMSRDKISKLYTMFLPLWASST